MLTGAAAVTNNAQAAAIDSVSGGEGDNSDTEPINVVRRYVPRFVGKREKEPVNDDIEANDKQSYSDVAEIDDLDDAVKDFVEYVNNMKYNAVQSESDSSSDMGENDEETEDLSYTIDDVTQEEKRYQPMFVGKRQYSPMFVGKRYQPMFVGKRYQPMFVGKRYQPMFVGKRYQPMFVGKRYQPMFVGKRYTPTFVGKRYTPTFVGKRYTPKFIGKRLTPSFVGKRDVSQENEVEELKNVRRKRSLSDDESEMYKRAWGRYMPFPSFVGYKRIPEQTTFKRFVAPEFIGRRDSLSSILSALDALQYIRHPARSTTKRFEAPMFIGKRPFTPSFVGKRGPLRPTFVGKRVPFTSDFSWDAKPEYGLSDHVLEWNPLDQSFSSDLAAYGGISSEKERL